VIPRPRHRGQLELDLKHLALLRAIVANEILRKPHKWDDEEGWRRIRAPDTLLGHVSSADKRAVFVIGCVAGSQATTP